MAILDENIGKIERQLKEKGYEFSSFSYFNLYNPIEGIRKVEGRLADVIHTCIDKGFHAAHSKLLITTGNDVNPYTINDQYQQAFVPRVIIIVGPEQKVSIKEIGIDRLNPWKSPDASVTITTESKQSLPALPALMDILNDTMPVITQKPDKLKKDSTQPLSFLQSFGKVEVTEAIRAVREMELFLAQRGYSKPFSAAGFTGGLLDIIMQDVIRNNTNGTKPCNGSYEFSLEKPPGIPAEYLQYHLAISHKAEGRLGLDKIGVFKMNKVGGHIRIGLRPASPVQVPSFQKVTQALESTYKLTNPVKEKRSRSLGKS